MLSSRIAVDSPAPGFKVLFRPAHDPYWLAALLLAVYFANGDCLASGDTLPSTCLPVSLLREGNVSFTPDEAPFMFRWHLGQGPDARRVTVRRWDQRIGGRRADELRAEGRLKPDVPMYYLVESAREGQYLGFYGPGPGLVALPVYLLGMGAVDDLPGSLPAVVWLGRISASLLSAASAVLLFLAAVARVRRGTAWALALVYGLGTCVWSQSSQALWQQTPVLFFFALAGWAVLREPATAATALVSGAAVGLAVVCRSTSMIVLVAVAWCWARRSPKLTGFFGLGLIPAVAIIAFHSAVYLESPFEYGHTDAAAGLALAKTGSMDLWQTPVWTGAAGILASPARGLLVYSPFLAFCAWGIVAAWKDPAWRPLRALSLALGGILALYFRWFDWWGGHSFGYRLVVDTMPLFALLLIPIAERIRSGARLRGSFIALAAWSVAVQFLGAFAYDQTGWNARSAGFEVRLPGEPKPTTVPTREEAERLARERGGKVTGEVELDVDFPEHRSRLWSLSDNPIFFYASHFMECRASKRSRMQAFLEMR